MERPKRVLLTCPELGAGCQLGHLESPPLGLSPSKRLTRLPSMVVLGPLSKREEADAIKNSCRQGLQLT